MCGIFGIVAHNNSSYSENFLNKSFNKLGSFSESRGKDSSGICTFDNASKAIDIIKGPIPISELLNNSNSMKSISKSLKKTNSFKLLFGHARLVTNGSQLNDNNNQPVVKDSIVCVHNGIITNSNELWNGKSNILKKYDIDTEILLSLIENNISDDKPIERIVSDSIKQLEGTVSVAIAFKNINKFILATNNGSLYTFTNNKDILFFASEKNILNKLIKRMNFDNLDNFELKNISPNYGLSIGLDNFQIKDFSFEESITGDKDPIIERKFKITTNMIAGKSDQSELVIDLNKIHLSPNCSKEKLLLQYPIDEIKTLKRCSKCVLPQTFPFIEFNLQGICNYCLNDSVNQTDKGISRLEKVVEFYRKNDGSPEVLVPISGGRDSCYTLHVAKEILGLNVLTYTYDWGMVTDLARRNIARICGKLSVENIVVSADMSWKRNNIRKNIISWLKYPSLGMIPLFMAGDKYFFYYAYKIKKEMNIDLELWGVNDLENTNFKTGFSGLKPEFDKEHIYSLSLKNKIKLFNYVGYNLVRSPGYINGSIIDSLGSFASRYVTPKSNYFHLFDYLDWDEDTVQNTIINNYNWEKSIDTDSTWRIGDGTASFYNYIYTLICGFSENDTFRSNQIRKGSITRDDALSLVYKENIPRYNSLKWYLEILGLEFSSVVKKINKIERLY